MATYSTDPFSPAVRVREFKQMVQALHQAGIRVIFDAVYNHTFNIDGSNFQRTYPDYYYRKAADGKYSGRFGLWQRDGLRETFDARLYDRECALLGE